METSPCDLCRLPGPHGEGRYSNVDILHSLFSKCVVAPKSYTVELNGLLMVICSNNWLKELDAYDEEGPEREYIATNLL